LNDAGEQTAQTCAIALQHPWLHNLIRATPLRTPFASSR
jgi:hypothetical protein